MSNGKVDVLFPVGRLVYGDLYKPNTTDYQGNPLTIKTGPNAGQPTSRFEFGVAIAKAGEQHWNQTSWGQGIYAAAMAGFPNGEFQRGDFSWKITDGDSQELNRNNKRPCDKEGYPGHWVVGFSTSLALKLFTDNGNTQLVQPGEIKPGYYVEVLGNVASNGNAQNPGMFVNPQLVNRAGFGQEIIGGPDAAAVGFGQGVLPSGASATPLGGGFNPAPTAAPGVAPQAMASPGAVQQPQIPAQQPAAQPMQQPQAAPQPQTPVQQPAAQQPQGFHNPLQGQPQTPAEVALAQQPQVVQQPQAAPAGVTPQPNFLNVPR